MIDKVAPQTTVYELLNGHPEIIPLFLRRKMACVGCNMARFETLRNAASIYRVDLDDWLKEIEQTISRDEITM